MKNGSTTKQGMLVIKTQRNYFISHHQATDVCFIVSARFKITSNNQNQDGSL